MNGPQDLGGKQYLGPIDPPPEAEEEKFHADWERRALALTLAAGMTGHWNLDMARAARENQHPVDYLSSTYYEIWLHGLETLLKEKGLASEAEQLGGHLAPGGWVSPKPPPGPETAAQILKTGASTARENGSEPDFHVGQKVRILLGRTPGHTRVPAYIQGHVGTVTACYGNHIYADAHAKGEDRAEPLYNVAFKGADLWGPEHDGPETVHVDVWQPHLAPA